MGRPAERSGEARVLAVVPARGGSKGLPGKNLRTLAGRSLLEHALAFAACCPEIDRTIVSTDDAAIAEAARSLAADVPFLRPPELGRDNTPMWPVLQHALTSVEMDDTTFDFLLLLDPTSPVRDPRDVGAMLARLRADLAADGIVTVSEPPFNPVWQCVVERDGAMAHLVDAGSRLTRRQDAPDVYYIDGSLYLWRSEFVRRERDSWFRGRLLMQVVRSAGTIDTADDLDRLEALAGCGRLPLPWLSDDR